MSYYETQTKTPIGCTSCAASGLGAYEAYVIGRTRRAYRVPVRALPIGAAPIVAVSGVGDDTVTPSQMGTFIGGMAAGAGLLWLVTSILYERRGHAR